VTICLPGIMDEVAHKRNTLVLWAAYECDPEKVCMSGFTNTACVRVCIFHLQVFVAKLPKVV
jgi:hypothetical protein